jgi:pSer/pThr/pTyr-binding forkhead associated (FHA) protein
MIWVEILSRGHDVVSRHRIDDTSIDRITIGRAYDNDVIIDDPYVAPHHVTLLREQQQGDDAPGWVAEDANSQNGMFVEGVKRKQMRVHLSHDRVLNIGRTLFRVRSSAAPVSAERSLPTPRHGWKLAIALMVAVLGVELTSAWLGESSETKISRYLFSVLAIVTALLLWTIAWALVSRVFSGQTKFDRHLLIAAAGLLALAIYNEIATYGAFAFSFPAISVYEYVVNWVIIGSTLFFHLREISPLHWRLKSGVVGAIAAIGIGSQWLSQTEAEKLTAGAQYLRQLRPPAVRVVPAQTDDAFFTSAENLKPTLDKARTEEKPEGSIFGGFDFED